MSLGLNEKNKMQSLSLMNTSNLGNDNNQKLD